MRKQMLALERITLSSHWDLVLPRNLHHQPGLEKHPGTVIHSVVDPDRDRGPHPGHADPDAANTDRYPFHENYKVDKLCFFPENFNMMSKIQKIYTPLTLVRKINNVNC